MTPAELIKIRRTLNLTQTKLGDEIGLTKTMISYMENGHKPISRTTELAVKYLELITYHYKRTGYI